MSRRPSNSSSTRKPSGRNVGSRTKGAGPRPSAAWTEQNLAEITEKLDALIDVVDKSIRRDGKKG
jgi:hypothetical protein